MIRLLHRRSDAREAAFRRLFEVHWQPVHEVCLRSCGDAELAKDLCQNIFLSVWERELSFEDELSARYYLVRCAKYQVLNHLRGQKTAIPVTEQTGAADRVEINRYNPEDMMSTAELSQRIDQELADLEEPGRTIFLLSREQQLSYSQIAVELGIAVKTVEKHMSRALRQLRNGVPV